MEKKYERGLHTGEFEIIFEPNSNNSVFESVMLLQSLDQEKQFKREDSYIKIIESAEEIVGI